MNKHLLYKYITQESLSAEEKAAVLRWIAASEENRQEYIELKQAWVLSGMANTKQVAAKRKQTRKHHMLTLARYAAVVLVAFLSGVLCQQLLKPANNQASFTIIEVPAGNRSLATLPDGTKVWLNAESKMSYPADFNRTNRELQLEGEGFFEVVKDEKHPFQINSNYGKVEVLGTSFNLKTYADMPFEATLMEGCIRFTSSNQQQCTLKPNQKLTIENNQLVISEVRAIKSNMWKSDGFYFDKEDFQTIVKRLERQYNVEITLHESLHQVRFSGQIYHTTLPEILEIIGKTQAISYVFSANHRQVTINPK